jgi:hypothetical protein
MSSAMIEKLECKTVTYPDKDVDVVTLLWKEMGRTESHRHHSERQVCGVCIRSPTFSVSYHLHNTCI